MFKLFRRNRSEEPKTKQTEETPRQGSQPYWTVTWYKYKYLEDNLTYATVYGDTDTEIFLSEEEAEEFADSLRDALDTLRWGLKPRIYVEKHFPHSR